MVDLEGELVLRAQHPLVPGLGLALAVADEQALALIREGVLEIDRAALGLDLQRAGLVRAVAGRAERQRAGGEAQGEGYRLLDLAVERVVRRMDLRLDRDRLLAHQRPHAVEAVESDIRQRSPAGQRLLQAPLLGQAHGLGVGRLDQPDLAVLGAAHQPHDLAVVGLVLAAIGDHQLHLRGRAGLDHRPRLPRGDRHRLLAQDVLAGARRGDHLVAVERVRGDDVDRLHLRVAGERVPAVVAVDRLRLDAVLRRHRLGLVGRARHQRDGLGLAALAEGRKDLLQRQPAEAHDREADPLGRRQRRRRGRGRAVGRSAPVREAHPAVLDLAGIDRPLRAGQALPRRTLTRSPLNRSPLGRRRPEADQGGAPGHHQAAAREGGDIVRHRATIRGGFGSLRNVPGVVGFRPAREASDPRPPGPTEVQTQRSRPRRPASRNNQLRRKAHSPAIISGEK